MKLLRDVHLEKVKKGGFESIFGDYRFSVKLPDALYLYDKAVLHLRRENTALGEALKSLPQLLIAHNQKVDSAEVDFIQKVNNAFASHKLTYDRTGGLFANVLKILSSVWRAYNGDLIKSSDRARLLDYFERSFSRDDAKDALYLGGQTKYPVWRGSEEEKTAVIESIRTVLVDSTILDSLNELENSKSAFALSLGQISRLAERMSKAIEAGDYTARAKCCPTVLGLIRNYFF